MSCREQPTSLVRMAKQKVLNFFESSLFNKVCRYFHDDRYMVLMYHGVVEDGAACAEGDWLQVTESEFKAQMAELKLNYHVVSFKDIVNNTVDKTNKKPKVVITFDDGYANNYKVAYPILKSYKLPATIFLVTDVIGTDKLFWYDRLFTTLKKIMPLDEVVDKIEDFKCCHPHIVDEKVDDYLTELGLPLTPDPDVKHCYGVLNMDQITEMADSTLINFGSHTHQHELLTLMTNREVKATLTESFDILESIPNNVPVFCYPNGYYKDADLHACADAGYKLAVKASGGYWRKKYFDFEVPRWGIGRGYSEGKFSSIVSGSLDFLQLITFRRK